MNLKNSIENIELCKLGEFASSLSTKYKFIKYKDVIDIWNCTLGQKVTGGSTSARSVPGSLKPAAERSKRPPLKVVTFEKPPPLEVPASPRAPRSPPKEAALANGPLRVAAPLVNKKKIIIDEDFDFFVASIKNKKKFILDEEEFIISKNRKHINVKIEDSIINNASPATRVPDGPILGPKEAAFPRSPPEGPASLVSKAEAAPFGGADTQTEAGVLDASFYEVEGGAENEDDDSDSIIKTILENLIIKDTIPKSISNYLSFSKKPMNIEKIVEFEDIEELIKDI